MHKFKTTTVNANTQKIINSFLAVNKETLGKLFSITEKLKVRN